MQRYIAEEIATDHVDGLLTRREAMRRLSLLGIGAAAGTALLAACGTTRTPTAATTSSSAQRAPAPPPGMENAVEPTAVTWDGPGGQLHGAWAPAQQPRGAVLVIHENKGLTDWVRSVVGRLAGVGYSALAIDLLSGQGGTAAFADPAQATAALGKIAPEQFVADMRSGIDELQRRTPGAKVGIVGFCMGGGLVWQLLAAGESRLSAASPFYGPLPENHDFSGSKQAAVLAFYGAKDQRVTSTKDAAQAALNQAGLANQIVVEPDADHAFFNDSGPRYEATAAADAWAKLQDWFAKNLA